MDSSDDEQISVKSRKKVATIDSDDETEQVEKPGTPEKSSPIKNNDSSDEELTISKNKTKSAAFADSDSDNEVSSDSPKKKSKRKIAAFNDDSDDSEVENPSQKLLKNKDLYDAEDSSEDENQDKETKNVKNSSDSGMNSFLFIFCVFPDFFSHRSFFQFF